MVLAGLAVGTRAPPVDVARKPRYVDARGPSGTPIARAGGGSPLRRRRKNTPARYIGDTSELWRNWGCGGVRDAPASALGGEMALAATFCPRPSLLELSCGFSQAGEGERELRTALHRTPAARLWRNQRADKEFVQRTVGERRKAGVSGRDGRDTGECTTR